MSNTQRYLLLLALASVFAAFVYMSNISTVSDILSISRPFHLNFGATFGARDATNKSTSNQRNDIASSSSKNNNNTNSSISSSSSSISRQNNTNQDVSTAATTKRTLSADEAFQQHCEQSGEWLSVGRLVFLKRAAAFYFYDAGFMRIHYLSTGDSLRLQVQINVSIAAAAAAVNGDETSADSAHYQSLVVNHTLDEPRVTMPWTVRRYSFAYMDVPLNLSALLIERGHTPPPLADSDTAAAAAVALARLRLDALVRDLTNGAVADRALRVHVKRLKTEFAAKHSALVCAKCFYLSRERDLQSTMWWIEMNKRIGYTHVAFCNQSIEPTTDDVDPFGRLFEQHAEFLIVTRLQCIPNLQTPGAPPKYYARYAQLREDNGDLDIYKIEVINQLVINECYLTHFDRYRYVAVLDNDETIIPKRSAQFFQLSQVTDWMRGVAKRSLADAAKPDSPVPLARSLSDALFVDSAKCDRYEDSKLAGVDPILLKIASMSSNSNSTSPPPPPPAMSLIEKHLTEIVLRLNYTPPKTFYFRQGFMLNANYVEQLFAALGGIFEPSGGASTVTTSATPAANASFFNYALYISDKRPENGQSTPFNHTVTITNEAEYEYARALWLVHKHAVRPYVERHTGDSALSRLAHNYDRFYMLCGSVNDYAWGKSIHDSRATFDLTVHHATQYISADRSAIYRDPNYLDLASAAYGSVPYEYGYQTHFRETPNFGYRTPYSIMVVQLDVNYINCFFRPILNAITKRTDF